MIPLDRLEEIARQKTKEALEGWDVPDHLRPDLTLGTFFEGDTVVFALYIANERPEDAIYLSEVRLTRSTGEGEVEIYREHLRRSAEDAASADCSSPRPSPEPNARERAACKVNALRDGCRPRIVTATSTTSSATGRGSS